MTACIHEGNLRANVDGELMPAEARSVSDHLLSCPRCRDRIEILRSSAMRVAVLMDRLEHNPAEPDCAGVMFRIRTEARGLRCRSIIRWAAAGASATLALLLLTEALLVKHPVVPGPASHESAPPSGSESIAGAPSSPPVAPDSTPAAGLQAGQEVDYFLGLDDGEPIQMGFVVRMSLPAQVLSPGQPASDAEEIQAEVIIDESGRPRAIRFPEIDTSAFGKDQR